MNGLHILLWILDKTGSPCNWETENYSVGKVKCLGSCRCTFGRMKFFSLQLIALLRKTSSRGRELNRKTTWTHACGWAAAVESPGYLLWVHSSIMTCMETSLGHITMWRSSTPKTMGDLKGATSTPSPSETLLPFTVPPNEISLGEKAICSTITCKYWIPTGEAWMV